MRYLVLSDIHGNAAALEAVLEDAPEWDQVLFLGDAVIAGPEPAAVLDRLTGLPGHFVEGNHDREVLELDVDRDPAGPNEAWKQWVHGRLGDTHWGFLEGLVETLEFELGPTRYRFVHGKFAPPDVDEGFAGRLWPDTASETVRALAERFDADVVVHGHAHVQFETTVDGTTFVNPGSVGAPRLGDPVACYGLLDEAGMEFHATPYDVERTCTAMDAVPIESSFAEEWKAAYRAGEIPERYGLRDFEPLRDGPWR